MKINPCRTEPRLLVPRNTKPTPCAAEPPRPSPTTYALAPTGTPTGTTPAHDRQLITSMANTEKAIVCQLAATRGRRKSVTFDASFYGPQDKRG